MSDPVRDCLLRQIAQADRRIAETRARLESIRADALPVHRCTDCADAATCPAAVFDAVCQTGEWSPRHG